MLYNGDCLEVMPTLKTNSVDMVLVDLPYGQTACSWDSVIDLDKMWIELERICKPNANIVFFCTTKFGYQLIKSKEKWFRSDIVWEKTMAQGFMSAKKAILRKHEMVYLFGKPSASGKTYNPQKTTGHKPGFRTAYTLKNANVYGSTGCYYKSWDDTRFPTSIQKFGYDKKKFHRTQKPLDLCEWLVKTYSNELDVVMDFTMGSGSTGVACKNTKRNFIGIEKDQEIFNIAKERLLLN
jgi:site-specific DNA-methyltransferase (adenine-specific)